MPGRPVGPFGNSAPSTLPCSADGCNPRVSMEQLGVGVVGLGYWGRKLVRAFSENSACRLVSAYDVLPERYDAAALPACTTRATDYGAMLRDPEIRAVAVVTPPATHFQLALRALQAGKHVFVEKPMTLATSEAAMLTASAAGHRVSVSVGHILLHHPAVPMMREWVRGGGLGTLLRAKSVRLSCTAAAELEAWWALAPHDISLFRHLFHAEPLAVTVTLMRRGLLAARLEYPRRLTAEVLVGSGPRKVRALAIQGAEATLVFDDTRRANQLGVRWRGASRAVTVRPDLSGEEPLAREVSAFIRCVRDGVPSPNSGAEGLAVTRVLEAGALSLRSGRRVELQPEPAAEPCLMAV